MYVTRYESSAFHPLANFEEDVNVSTGSAAGVRIDGDSLTAWREARIPFRGRGDDTQETNAAWLGWNRRVAGDSGRLGEPASYSVQLPDSLARAWHVTADGALSLQLAATNDVPKPRAAPKGSPAAATGTRGKPPAKKAAADTVKPPIDLTVELRDAAGTVARLPLSRYGPIRRPLETHILRRGDRESRQFRTPYELVLQSYTIPLSDFVAAAPGLDVTTLRRVVLRFDRAVAGTVVVDEIGIGR